MTEFVPGPVTAFAIVLLVGAGLVAYRRRRDGSPRRAVRQRRPDREQAALVVRAQQAAGQRDTWEACLALLEQEHRKLTPEARTAFGVAFPQQVLRMAADPELSDALRARAVDCLHGESIASADALELLGRLAQEPHSNVLRVQATQALGLVAPAAAVAASEKLLPVLEDTSGRIRRDAVRALASLKSQDAAVALEEALIPMLRGETGSVTRTVAVLLGQYGGKEATVQALSEGAAGAEPNIAIHMQAALLRLGASGAEERVRASVGATAAKINRVACKALARWGTLASVQPLLDMGRRQSLARETAHAIQERLGHSGVGGLAIVEVEGGELSTWDDPEGLLTLDEDEVG